MLKKVFLIGGMSESGKSTVGKYLDTLGIKRFKIVTYLTEVMKSEGGSGDFQEWNDRAESERPDWLKEQFVEEFVKATGWERIEYCCLESLYKPEFGQFIKSKLPDVAVIVCVDAPLEIRVQRQVIRENLTSVEQAKAILLPRDTKKEGWGTHRIKEIADVVIDNSGDMETLKAQTRAMVKRYCPELQINH